MDQEINRLLLQQEKAIREINHQIIDPVLPQLTLDGLNPVASMVARTRARYLKGLFDLANSCADCVPAEEQVDELRVLREAYEEMVAGAQALDVAIQRGYLDVKSDRK